jgi:hypothetical protein
MDSTAAIQRRPSKSSKAPSDVESGFSRIFEGHLATMVVAAFRDEIAMNVS